MVKRYFLTVEWCRNGNRGIFCDRGGNCFSKDEPHTLDEMREILGPFWLVLGPESMAFSEQEVFEHSRWFPLMEYKGVFGFAMCEEVRQ